MSGWKFLALAGLMSAGAAAAPTQERALTAEALAADVLENNPGVAAQRAALRSAHARVEPAGSLEDPMLTVAAAPGTFDDPALDPRGQVQVSQALPWPGTLDARRERALALARIENAGLGELELRLREAAMTAFADWYLVHRELTLNAEHRDILAELHAVARTRYATGRASQRHVLAAQAELARLEDDALGLASRRDAVRARINALLNRPPGEPLASPAALNTPEPLPNLGRLLERAGAGHPELRQLALRERAATAGVTLAEKAFYPDFRLFAGYNGVMDPAAKRPMIGVTLSLPLDRSRRHAALDEARAERLRAQWRLEEHRAELLNRLEAAHAVLVNTRASVKLHTQQLLPLARGSLDSALSDYSAGRGDFLDVLDAERGRLSAELGLVRARARELTGRAALERLAGLSPETPPDGPIPATVFRGE